MIKPIEAAPPAPNIRERIIVALDVETADEAREISRELSASVGAFKIGLQLFTTAGPRLVREFIDAGEKVFLDLKFHDIPNTVAKASVEAARHGVWMLNVHASGGREMMHRTSDYVAEICEKESIKKPLIVAVTVLTSSNAEMLGEVGVATPVVTQVQNLALLAAECGLDGVVVSPHEISAVRTAVYASNFLVVTPGIRSISATNDDQKRVTTIRQALANGSDYVVIGRPITQAKDRLQAVESLVREAMPTH